MNSSRYYEDNEDEIQPGKISDELRAALNLAENDIPIWIYRMRAIGYPPGWLRKAMVDTEDIFDTDAVTLDDTNPGKRKRDDTRYDHTKLIEYPGFNMPLPPNTHDYHYYYNMPPMLPHQQLDYAKKIMREPAPAPPLKRSRNSDGSSHDQSTSSAAKNDEDNTSNSDDDEEEEEEEGNDDVQSPESPDPEPTESAAANDTTTSIQEKSADISSSSVKLVSNSSPMPKRVERLPLERFSEGVVGELLYFENIPNSTGKFDTIRGLLNKMRRSKSEADTSSSSSFTCKD